jgi:hypothetical protein
LLAEFEALSDDTSNSESESEGDAEEIGDKYEIIRLMMLCNTKRSASSFQWQRGNFVPQIHNFDNENSGILANLDENCSF